MTRTEELIQGGAEVRGKAGSNGDNPPFVVWPEEEYAFIEGVVKEIVCKTEIGIETYIVIKHQRIIILLCVSNMRDEE